MQKLQTVFVYTQKTKPTGKALATALGVRAFRDSLNLDFRSLENVVCWGARAESGRRVWNVKAWGSSDKFRALRVMQDNGVPVPFFDIHPDAVMAKADSGTVLGRNFNHTQGRDVVVAHTLQEARLANSQFFVAYIPKVREYRLHVFGDRVIYTQVKRLEHPEQADPNAVVWNHKNGYALNTQEGLRLNQTRIEAAVKAVAALGLDFGAVDLIVDEKGQEYVLEVNTAPGLEAKSLRAYVEAFRQAGVA